MPVRQRCNTGATLLAAGETRQDDVQGGSPAQTGKGEANVGIAQGCWPGALAGKLASQQQFKPGGATGPGSLKRRKLRPRKIPFRVNMVRKQTFYEHVKNVYSGEDVMYQS